MDPMPELSLMGPSKTKILLLLRTEKGTATNIASSLHMQVSAARKHLELLVNIGLVAETFQSGTVGRPKKFYMLTENGKEVFPRKYDTLLNNLITKLADQEGLDYVESLMKVIARDVAKSLDGQDLNKGEQVKHVQSGVNQLGFEATVNRDNGNLTVISRNCPVWKAAVEQREVVCRGYHAELLKAALKAKSVERKEWMVDGDNYCKHILGVPAK